MSEYLNPQGNFDRDFATEDLVNDNINHVLSELSKKEASAFLYPILMSYYTTLDKKSFIKEWRKADFITDVEETTWGHITY